MNCSKPIRSEIFRTAQKPFNWIHWTATAATVLLFSPVWGCVNVKTIQERLSALTKDNIRFNEPHFTTQLLLREGSRAFVIQTVLNPESLVRVITQEGKYGDTKYVLHFAVGHKTLMLPVIFDDKGLYILTYIVRHRRS